jgi:hypothetical protein
MAGTPYEFRAKDERVISTGYGTAPGAAGGRLGPPLL